MQHQTPPPIPPSYRFPPNGGRAPLKKTIQAERWQNFKSDLKRIGMWTFLFVGWALLGANPVVGFGAIAFYMLIRLART